MFGGISRNDVGFLKETYDAIDRQFPATAAKDDHFFDILGVHPYSGNRSPEAIVSNEVYHDQWGTMDENFLGIELLHNLMAQEGEGWKHVYIGEYGFSTGKLGRLRPGVRRDQGAVPHGSLYPCVPARLRGRPLLVLHLLDALEPLELGAPAGQLSELSAHPDVCGARRRTRLKRQIRPDDPPRSPANRSLRSLGCDVGGRDVHGWVLCSAAHSRDTRERCTAPCFPRKATGGRALLIGTTRPELESSATAKSPGLVAAVSGAAIA